MHHLAANFFPLFGALFLIASVVSFVQLATLTSTIKMSFVEMLLLYLTYVPNILLFTLPITFFAALTITLSKLSADLELIVLFGLKTSVAEVLKPFVALSLLLGAALLILGLILQPKAKFAQRTFIYAKQNDAQINIRASEFGQRFGDWLLFVGSQKTQNLYSDVILFSRSESDRQSSYFVAAKEAKIENLGGVLSLLLSEGKAYQTGDQKITEVEFSNMQVNESGQMREFEFGGIATYWSKMGESRAIAREFSGAILAGLFVILCVPAAALGIHNPRFQKGRPGFLALGLILLFYVPAFTLSDKGIPFMLAVALFWIIFILWLYRRRVGRTF